MPASVPVIDLMPWFSADETARAAVERRAPAVASQFLEAAARHNR